MNDRFRRNVMVSARCGRCTVRLVSRETEAGIGPTGCLFVCRGSGSLGLVSYGRWTLRAKLGSELVLSCTMYYLYCTRNYSSTDICTRRTLPVCTCGVVGVGHSGVSILFSILVVVAVVVGTEAAEAAD